MPIPVEDAVAAQAAAAADKAVMLRKRPLQYLVLAMLAGAFVGVAVLLLIMISATFVKSGSVATKLVQGSVFGVALTLVVFAGGELFTGVVMTMIQGVVARTAKVTDLIGVWVAALVGNFVGALLFSALVAASGVVNLPDPKHKATVFLTALAGIVKTKGALSGAELFWRAVLCNFLVCLGLWMAARTTSDAAKLICLFWALLAFVASGFEHSVANMTFFGIAIFTHADGATLHALVHNLTYTVPGNIVGGGLLVAGAYSFASAGSGGSVTPAPGGAAAWTAPESPLPAGTTARSREDTPIATAPAVTVAPTPAVAERAPRPVRARTTTPPPRTATRTRTAAAGPPAAEVPAPAGRATTPPRRRPTPGPAAG